LADLEREFRECTNVANFNGFCSRYSPIRVIRVKGFLL
jgi:hypothetical protein